MREDEHKKERNSAAIDQPLEVDSTQTRINDQKELIEKHLGIYLSMYQN